MKTALIALTFIWCGLVLGLSFIETPLKFQAPDITRELGLGIGQLVFTALNRIEWFCSAAVIMLLVRLRPAKACVMLYALIVAIVILQTLVLLPLLDERVDMIRSGTEPDDSPVHWIFIGVEIAKIIALLAAGVILTSGSSNQAKPTDH